MFTIIPDMGKGGSPHGLMWPQCEDPLQGDETEARLVETPHPGASSWQEWLLEGTGAGTLGVRDRRTSEAAIR
jgi:hypothetical protein